jgi:hypothetical protein
MECRSIKNAAGGRRTSDKAKITHFIENDKENFSTPGRWRSGIPATVK